VRTLRLAAVLAASLLAAGCAPVETGAASQTAADFQSRVAAGDWTAACTLLSDRARSQLETTAARSCPAGLAAVRLPTGSVAAVQVWGHNAVARSDDEALFLSRFSTGWRVVAAGCTSRGEDQPYACAVRS